MVGGCGGQPHAGAPLAPAAPSGTCASIRLRTWPEPALNLGTFEPLPNLNVSAKWWLLSDSLLASIDWSAAEGRRSLTVGHAVEESRALYGWAVLDEGDAWTALARRFVSRDVERVVLLDSKQTVETIVDSEPGTKHDLRLARGLAGTLSAAWNRADESSDHYSLEYAVGDAKGAFRRGLLNDSTYAAGLSLTSTPRGTVVVYNPVQVGPSGHADPGFGPHEASGLFVALIGEHGVLQKRAPLLLGQRVTENVAAPVEGGVAVAFSWDFGLGFVVLDEVGQPVDPPRRLEVAQSGTWDTPVSLVFADSRYWLVYVRDTDEEGAKASGRLAVFDEAGSPDLDVELERDWTPLALGTGGHGVQGLARSETKPAATSGFEARCN